MAARAPIRRVRVTIGLIAVAVGLACGSAAFAAVSPALGTPDETAHVDYGYQVWHGRLPVFEDGISFTPGPGARVPPVQWEAQHPPLYYLLIAPVVGPLIDSGHWRVAVLAARGVNILLAVSCLGALAWAGSLLARRRRWAWAIAVPAVVAPISPFMRVGGSVYNDNLSALLAILALGVAILVLRRGPTARRLVLAAVLSGLGSLARGSFVVTLLVVSVALAVGVWLHDPGRGPARLGRGLLAAVLPSASALVAGGWFYLRNIRLTGSWTGGHADWAQANLRRRPRPVAEVLSDVTFWTEHLQLLRQRAAGSADRLGPRVLLVVAAVGAVAGLVWLVRSARRTGPEDPSRAGAAEGGTAASGDRRPSPLLVQVAVVLALAAQLGGLLLVEVAYAAIGGGVITRYLLPGLLPIGALLAAGVLAAGRRLAGLALLAYLVLAWGLFGQWLWIVSTPNGFPTSGSTGNGVPWLAVWAVAAGLAVAVLAQAVALTDWSRREPEPDAAEPPTDPQADEPTDRTADMEAWPTSVITS